MDNQVFSLLMARFDTLEAQNNAQIQLIQAHVEADEQVHKVVERHSAYFKLVGLGVPTFLGWIAYKLGLPK